MKRIWLLIAGLTAGIGLSCTFAGCGEKDYVEPPPVDEAGVEEPPLYDDPVGDSGKPDEKSPD